MKQRELVSIAIAIVLLWVIISLDLWIAGQKEYFGMLLLFSAITILANVISKKAMGSRLDAGVEHKIWQMSRFGPKKEQHLKKPFPTGIFIPLIISAISLGFLKVMTLLEYETTALKRRAAKRHGYYSFTEMTDWHNAIVGASGIIIMFIISVVSYFIPGAEPLSRIAVFYAFWNMIPFSRLDGAQIYFGSRPLWYVLAIITLIFVSYALFLI